MGSVFGGCNFWVVEGSGPPSLKKALPLYMYQLFHDIIVVECEWNVRVKKMNLYYGVGPPILKVGGSRDTTSLLNTLNKKGRPVGHPRSQQLPSRKDPGWKALLRYKRQKSVEKPAIFI